MEIWESEEWKSKAKNETVSDAQKNFISSLNKNIDFRCMSKLDASNLINILQRCQNSYAPCGRHRSVEPGRAEVLGDLDWCLHNCNIDVHECEHWKNEENDNK